MNYPKNLYFTSSVAVALAEAMLNNLKQKQLTPEPKAPSFGGVGGGKINNTMNYPKILYFTCLLSGMILFVCNNNSYSNSSDEKTAEEIGKAILHTNLTDISPISVEELEAWLPKTLGGMSLTSSAPGSMSRSGISGIAATYGNPYEKSVKLLLTDCAGEQASAMGLAGSFRRLMNQNIDENTEMGYQKTVTNKGVKAIENYNSDTEYKNTLYSFFVQSLTELTPKMHLALGVNYTGLTYDYSDYLFTERSGKKKMDAEPSPRIALSYEFGDFLSLHGSMSSGFSAPTTNEIRNVDGSVNRDLKSQKAINYEVNAKGSFFGKRLNYDLALYEMDMKNELIPQAVQQGITIYRNSGKTKHRGIELALA